MPPKPYIGITGFMSQEEVQNVLNAYPKDAQRRLMIGVLMSDKTLAGGVSSKYPGRYPTRDKMESIFVDDPRALNLVHFHTKTTGYAIVAELIIAKTAAGPHCHGFQLNMKWPDPRILADYHHASSLGTLPKQDIIVLQCGSGAMQAIGNSAQTLVNRVSDYWGLVDYVLIDPSGGKGLPLDLHFVHDCLCAFAETRLGIGVCIAGGLCAQAISTLKDVAFLHQGNFSIDAEGQLRDASDKLDLAAANQYTQAANVLFKRCKLLG